MKDGERTRRLRVLEVEATAARAECLALGALARGGRRRAEFEAIGRRIEAALGAIRAELAGGSIPTAIPRPAATPGHARHLADLAGEAIARAEAAGRTLTRAEESLIDTAWAARGRG